MLLQKGVNNRIAGRHSPPDLFSGIVMRYFWSMSSFAERMAARRCRITTGLERDIAPD
ncbi:MAG: hypothetical protein L7W95_07890 [Alphaproteobacteria bacterium]|nr:hypothetical protein [Alphaproteobacteria bacterium]